MPVKTPTQRLRAKRHALLRKKSARHKTSHRAAAKSTGADEKSAAARRIKVKAAVLAARLAARTLRAAAARRVVAQARSVDVARGALTFPPGCNRWSRHPDLVACTRQLARRVSFTVATRTISGTPIQSTRGQQEQMELDGIRPNEKARDVAIARLEKLGFDVLHKGRFATTVAGPAELVREVLGEPLMVMRQAEKPANARRLHFRPRRRPGSARAVRGAGKFAERSPRGARSGV